MIVDRVEINVQRDPFTLADSDTVVFRARRRTGAQVIQPAALRDDVKRELGLAAQRYT